MVITEKVADRILDCDLCGARPAQVCMLRSVQGRLVYYNRQEYVGHLCASCLKSVYVDYTLVTATEGWWSIWGFVRTPLAIVANTTELITCLRGLRRISRSMRR